jgi:hypothetical protein
VAIVQGLPAFMTGILMIALSAEAADRAVHLQVLPPVRPDVASMPLIVDPADAAENGINDALRRLDATVGKAANDCKGFDGKTGDWTRTIDVPMRGPGYISFVIHDSVFCGGAHPDDATMSIVYDLRTGTPVDWTHLLPLSLIGNVALAEGADGTKMVTLASKRLYDLYLRGYHRGDESADTQAECKQVIGDAGNDGPPAMMPWLDAKAGGLAIQFDLPHAVQVCAQAVVIPAETLRLEGAQRALVDAFQNAGQR